MPIYETTQSLSIERGIAADIEKLWSCRLEKLPRRFCLDYACVRGYNVCAWLELKTAPRSVVAYPEYVLSLDKWFAARQYLENTGLPVILYVRFSDRDAIYRHLGVGTTPHIGFLNNGRQGRFDDDDKCPVVRIPISSFECIPRSER